MPDRFSYIKRGYDPSEVDNYIDALETVIRSYKEKDAAIKNAIINAQIAADNIVKNAELEAERIKADAAGQVEGIYNSIMHQRELLEAFCADYTAMFNKYMHPFDAQDMSSVQARIDSLAEYLAELNKTHE